MRNSFVRYSATVFVFSIALAAQTALAGGDRHERPNAPVQSNEESMGFHDHPFDFGEPGNISEATRTIRVVAEDIHFAPRQLSLRASETVLFEIANNGKLLHEFSIGTPEAHESHRARIAMMLALGLIQTNRINYDRVETGQAPADEAEPHYDPTSVFVEPNDTRWVAWKFTKALELEFACNIPGHYEAGMKGKIVVN